jgi:hypothetical protein
MDFLLRLLPMRGFTLPRFNLVPLEFDGDPGEDRGELILDDVIASIGQPTIVAPVQPMPTAGELQATIERHLNGSTSAMPRMEPADELRHALTELRRSLA